MLALSEKDNFIYEDLKIVENYIKIKHLK